MKPKQRYEWIEQYLLKQLQLHGKYAEGCNIVDRYFVDQYIEAVQCSFYPMYYGADKCPQLGRDLARMHKVGRLKRSRCGIEGMAGMGFPRWVYIYKLPSKSIDR